MASSAHHVALEEARKQLRNALNSAPNKGAMEDLLIIMKLLNKYIAITEAMK